MRHSILWAAFSVAFGISSVYASDDHKAEASHETAKEPARNTRLSEEAKAGMGGGNPVKIVRGLDLTKVDAKESAKEEAAPADKVDANKIVLLPPTYKPVEHKPVVRKKPKVVNKTPVQEHHDIHWSYEGEGAPDKWGDISAANKLCKSGTRQSPIDIRDGIKLELEPIRFDYKPSYFRVVDNGHTIQVNLGSGNTMNINGKQYDLLQFHFHRPSEERVNGRAFDMVAHLVHKDLDGNLAVVAVLLERGYANPVIQTIWNNLPLEKNTETAPEVALDVNALLPTNRQYYTYMGSLTTPPCSEGVLWLVLKQSVPLSHEQIGVFARLYKNNARPVQPSNGRMIKEAK